MTARCWTRTRRAGGGRKIRTAVAMPSSKVVGTKLLKLPSNKVLELKIYYYMPKIIRNIISIPLLLEQDFEIKRKSNGCSIYFSNEFPGNTYIDNGLLFLSLNDNILHVDKIKKRKREDVNVTYL